MATILDNIRKDAQAITRQCIRKNMPPPRMIQAAICWNLANIDFTYDWTHQTIAAGTEKLLIKKLKMRVCKKKKQRH